MNWFNRLFRTDATRNTSDVSFVDNSFFKNHSIKTNTAKGIYEMYSKNIVLRAIVEKIAEIFSRFEYQELDSKGQPIPNSTKLNPFLKPLIQNREQFIKMFAIQYLLYDTVFILHKDNILGVFTENSKLNILDYPNILINWKIQQTKEFTDIKEQINYIDYFYNNQYYRFFPSEFEIISKYELTQDQLFTLESAEDDLNTIYKALVIRNKYNTNTQLGMITPSELKMDANNPRISTIIKDDEKELIQKELRQYSSFNGQYNLMVGKQPMQYIDLMPTIQNMMLEESTSEAILRVCSLLNFPASSLNMLINSTYANKEFGNKDVYTDLVIPLWNLYENTCNQLYNFKYNINIDYSFIEALQPDKKTEYEISNLQADAIIKLNTEVKSGNLTKEIATNILINTYGFDSNNAKLYINDATVRQ